MGSKVLAAAMAAGLVLAAGSASAAVFTVTYTGTVAPGGSDDFNYFGVGTDLGGQAFTLSFKVDTGTPGAGPRAEGLTEHYFEGYDAATPVKGSFKIGTQTITFGDSYGYDYRFDNSLDPACASDCAKAGMEQKARDTFFDEVAGVITSRSVLGYGDAYDYAGLFSGLAHVPTGNFDTSNAYFFGGFSAEAFTYDRANPGYNYSLRVDANLKVDAVSVSAAPEPAAWALMILGFSGVGVALRRRAFSLP